MCGIIGKIDFTKKIDRNVFNEMRDTMHHRGPDGFGSIFLRDDHVALGHRRLSIIDLSKDGHQPMANENNTIWLTFNGEIYNYKILRQELSDKHTFRSNSDSEVLIHGFEEWGIEGLVRRIKGMFAFAIWDSKQDDLYLVRDRFGIKPLYYYWSEERFIFASEAKAILSDKSLKRTVDRENIAKFLCYSYIPNPQTPWSEIHKLPPATYLKFDLKTIKKSKYWNPVIDNKIISDDDAIEQAYYLLKKSTIEHLESDVPVGLFLSGGYDSSMLLSIMKEKNERVSTFNIGFKDAPNTEHHLSAQIASSFNTQHKTRVIDKSEDIFEIVEDLALYYDEPYAISSMIPYHLVSKLAAETHKVVLAGDGGDEAFAGYKWHYFAHSLAKPSPIDLVRNFLFNKRKRLINQYSDWMPGVGMKITGLNVLSPQYHIAVANEGVMFYDNFYYATHDYIKLFQVIDFNSFIPEPCLTRADRAGMAHSLETRVPFLDHEIFDFMFSLSSDVYFKKGVKKFLIHENLKKHVSQEILSAPKRGFGYPFLDSLTGKRFEQFLENGELKKNQVLRSNTNWTRVPSDVKFNLLMLEFWFRNYG